MASLKLAVAVLALAISAPGGADSIADWRSYIDEASLRFGVPASWIERVMHAESDGQTMLNGRPIRSRAGAIGLMQLMPGTWEMMRRALALGLKPDDPHDNILAGALYLRMMFDRFGYPGLFAAYDAGPSRFAAHLASDRPLPRETIAYLRKVSEGPPIASETDVRRPREALFATQNQLEVQHSKPASRPANASLFAVRNDDP